MFANPSLTTRVGVGKLVGLVVGLTGFVTLPYLYAEASWTLRWGVLLWYYTMGAVIGVFGVVDRHPVLQLPMPWWFRAPVIGAWFNFVLTFFAYDQLTFFAYDQMEAILISLFGPDGAMTSPFWFVAEGAIVGAIIGFCATRLGGEGPETVAA